MLIFFCVCVCLFVVLFMVENNIFITRYVCCWMVVVRCDKALRCAKESLWVRKLNDRGMRRSTKLFTHIHTHTLQQQTHNGFFILFYCDSSLWEASSQNELCLKYVFWGVIYYRVYLLLLKGKEFSFYFYRLILFNHPFCTRRIFLLVLLMLFIFAFYKHKAECVS